MYALFSSAKLGKIFHKSKYFLSFPPSFHFPLPSPPFRKELVVGRWSLAMFLHFSCGEDDFFSPHSCMDAFFERLSAWLMGEGRRGKDFFAVLFLFRIFAAVLVTHVGVKREAGESPAQSRCCELESLRPNLLRHCASP